MHFCESFFACVRLGQWGSEAVRQWCSGTGGGWEDETVASRQHERMRGWEDERTGSRREEEGWREEADKAVYHDSLERVCPRQTPSRSPSPGRRYVILTWNDASNLQSDGSLKLLERTGGGGFKKRLFRPRGSMILKPCTKGVLHKRPPKCHFAAAKHTKVATSEPLATLGVGLEIS